jgi:tight adherence protein C
LYLDPLALGVAALTAGGLAAAVVGVRSLRDRSHALASRLADLEADPVMLPRVQPEAPRRAGILGRLLAPIARIARPGRREEVARLQTRLLQAGIRGEHAATVYLGTKVVLAVAALGGFLAYNARQAEPVEPALLVAIVIFASGFYVPEAWLSSRTQRRQTQIERGLPDALDLLVTCVEAGLGLDSSLQRVADELELAWTELSSELRTTFLEVKAGIPRVEAFRRLASRTGVRDLKSLSATLTQTEIFGTSVALALRIQAEGIRIRRMQRAEEKAAYVAVKMTLPLILCILPSLMAIIIGPAMVNIASTLLPMLGGR